MLSLSLSLTTPNLNSPISNHRTHHHLLKPISAALNFDRSSSSNTPPPPPQRLYQPFRPPPTPLPSQFGTLDLASRIDILANRLGQWYEYAPLIPTLAREGFSPPTIEEVTGITGVDQNRLVVAAQVRDSLIQSNADPQVVAAFDNGGAPLLYEIRLLSASQRAAAARFIVLNGFDGKGAQELARSIKDFPSRRGEKGWDNFDYTLPGDCLSYMYYRQGREHRDDQRNSALEQALRVVESEKAKSTVLEELKRQDGEQDKVDEVETVRVPVVRLKIGEVAEASSVVVLPVCKSKEKGREVLEAPFECRSEGEFGVVVAEKGWERWVVLPRWDPLVGLQKGGVAVSFPDARVLPWKANRWYKEEPILVVADRSKKEVGADDGFYLVKVDGDGLGLKVERGLTLKEVGVEESLGAVVLVVRPPKEDNDDQLSDEDWD